MHSARALVLIVALASSCIPYSGQTSTSAATEEESPRSPQQHHQQEQQHHQKQHPGLLSLLKAASRIARQYSPPQSRFLYDAPQHLRGQEQGTDPRSSNVGFSPFLRFIAPSAQSYGGVAVQEEPPLQERQHVVGGKPPEEDETDPLGLEESQDDPFASEDLDSRPIIWAKKSEGAEPQGGSPGANFNGEEEQVRQGLQQMSASIASNFLRTGRSASQPYDVPQIECPPAEDQMDRFPCPSPDRMGRYRCIDDHVLCDGFIDCPDAEDEDRQHCMFYKTTKAHLDIMADAIIRFIRSPK